MKTTGECDDIALSTTKQHAWERLGTKVFTSKKPVLEDGGMTFRTI